MIIKITALGIIGAFLATLLKKYNKELVPFFEIAVVVCALFVLKDELEKGSSAIKDVFSLLGKGDEMFTCIFKGAVITVITKLASEVCRESGNSLMGEIVEIGGRVMLIVLSLPFITQVTQTALSFIE